jgi:hypothetical protein
VGSEVEPLNEKKAKKLRKLIFGDQVYRGSKEYVAIRHEHKSRLVDIPSSGGVMLDLTPFTVMIKPETPHSYYRALKRLVAKGVIE